MARHHESVVPDPYLSFTVHSIVARLAIIATPGKKKQSSTREDTVKTNYKVAIALVAGAAIGGAAIQGLHAQAKPPVYVVSEITVTNPEAYGKEYAPKAQASIKAAG